MAVVTLGCGEDPETVVNDSVEATPTDTLPSDVSADPSFTNSSDVSSDPPPFTYRDAAGEHTMPGIQGPMLKVYPAPMPLPTPELPKPVQPAPSPRAYQEPNDSTR